MSQDILTLRALEPGDIDVLLNIENDKEFWKYSIKGNLSQGIF